MEVVVDRASDINNNDLQIIYCKESLTPEMQHASILIRLATHVLEINAEDLLAQLPLQTDRLRNWCPLSGGRRNTEDELLKQEIKERITEYEGSISQISGWKGKLQSISERLAGYRPDLIEEIQQIKTEYLKNHSKEIKDKRKASKDSLKTKSSNRITSDKLNETSSGELKLNLYPDEFKLILACNDTTQKLFENQFKTYHDNTVELKKLKENLDSQFKNLLKALSELEKEYNPLYEELIPSGSGLLYNLSSTPDHLNSVINNDAMNDNVIVEAELTKKQISENEYLEFMKEKEKIENSSIYKYIKAKVVSEELDDYDKFIEVFKGKIEEASVSYDNLEQVKLQVHYWEKMPIHLKKSPYISLMDQAQEYLHNMQGVIDNLINSCNEMVNFSEFDLSRKINHLNNYQSLFKKMSTEIIDPLLEAEEDKPLERESLEEVKKRLQDEIDKSLWKYIYSQELIENAFDIRIGLLSQRFIDLHKMKSEFATCKIDLNNKFSEMNTKVKSFRNIWESKLREAVPALQEPSSWSSQKKYIDFIDLSKDQDVLDAVEAGKNKALDLSNPENNKTTTSCIVS